ncbi:MAG: YfhO family protein [Thermodesulfobacteriota bacterium]
MPFVDALLASSTLAVRHHAMAAASALYHAAWLQEAATGVTLLYPTFFGTPVSGNFAWPFEGLSNYNRQTLYFGALGLALACAAVSDPRRRRPVGLLAGLALACLLIAWRFPLLEAVNHLPLLTVVRNDRLRLPFAFFGAVLAGFGFDALCSRDRVPARACRALRVVLGVTILLPLVLLALAPLLPADAPEWAQRLARHLADHVFVRSLPQSWTPLAVAVAAILVVGTPAGTRLLGGSGRKAAVVALVGGELLVLGWGYNPSVTRELVFPPTRTTRLVGGKPVPARVIATGAFWPNYGTPYDAAQIEAYDLPVPRLFADLYRAQGGRAEDHHQRWRADWPLTALLGVEFVVSPQPVKQRGLRPLLQDGGVWVYRNERALPRAWLVHQTAVARDDAEALSELAGGRFDFTRAALLERALPADVARALGEAPPGARSSASFVEYRPNRVVLDVDAVAPGLLVTSEAHATGWSATVDGAPAAVHRANHAFRAVVVPRGRHRVVFRYAPWPFHAGRAASVAAVLLAALLAAAEARRRRTARPAR